MVVPPNALWKVNPWAVAASSTAVMCGELVIGCGATAARAAQIAADHNTLLEGVAEVLDLDYIRWRGRRFEDVRDELFEKALQVHGTFASTAEALAIGERTLPSPGQSHEEDLVMSGPRSTRNTTRFGLIVVLVIGAVLAVAAIVDLLSRVMP